MTFQQLCRDLNVTPWERAELAWHLAMMRARRLVRELTGDKTL